MQTTVAETLCLDAIKRSYRDGRVCPRADSEPRDGRWVKGDARVEAQVADCRAGLSGAP